MNREQMIAWLTLEGWVPYHYSNGVHPYTARNGMLGYWRAPHFHYVTHVSKEVNFFGGADHRWRDNLACENAYISDEFCLLHEHLASICASIIARQETEK